MDRTNAVLVSLILGVAASAAADAPTPVTLWVWHGEHDLRGLHAATGGQARIAYHARTLRLEEGRVVVSPRRGALLLDSETERTAVVRIEVEPRHSVLAFRDATEGMLRAMAPVFREPRVSALQIDFDAPASLRGPYGELLGALRTRMPGAWRLEMTALGSWCAHDRWLEGVPVDRIVPMLFGPGHEQPAILAALSRGPLPEPRCRESHGLREGDPRVAAAPNVYVFPLGRWTLARAVAVWQSRQEAARAVSAARTPSAR